MSQEHVSIPVRSGSSRVRPYEVHVGHGAWTRMAQSLASRPPADRYVLVCDSNVAPLHGPTVLGLLRRQGLCVDPVEIPAGEFHKTRATRALLEDRLVELGVGRDGAVLALGGGVVGDLAGFVAATYHRGIPWVALPTTLVAMVDASIGGKTGHDLPGGKNLVGAFHPPAAVHADLVALETLPQERYREGFAETIKHGLVADPDLVRDLETGREALLAREGGALLRALHRAIAVKAGIVGRDPLEAGERAVLNFGHTVGHALETVSGYRMPHGEAVARGMVVEADLSARAGALAGEAAGRIRDLLRGYGLPVTVPEDLPTDALLSACRRDKKSRRGEIRCVRLAGVGQAACRGGEWTFAVDPGDLLAALEAARGPY